MAAASPNEVIIIPRSFKLLDELEDAEKGRGVPAPHTTCISLGLMDSGDMTLSKWNVTMMGLNGTVLQDRFYTLVVECPPNYPNVPPKIWFKSKINLPGVDQTTGLVNASLIGGWSPKSTMAMALCNIRASMKAGARLAQPPDGAEY